ncbi:LOW QUALITY PROTEIN: RELT-like protein 2 [Microcaecilia unicolor]|uniref:LOW QUALITY PROTEIN: RELT-like protein 2 n=1 Tax=Microcaecilia unicolor TaxID=1415580 RepID=A0A6P7YUH7_9AMPH|nr:LOW QUALITY PROTEIN: RELT-like protein 2 [Microcaecilia unicolor]
MAEENSMEDEEAGPQQSPYMLFLLVLLFFFTGLLGFLICHVLKKKGYRCRTFPDDQDPETKDALKENQSNSEEASNEDTVERIVKCIIQNEANAEALKQMLGDNEREVAAVPSLCPHRGSQDAGPPHHHTVHLGSTLAPCIHCKKKSRLHRMGRSKEGKGRPQPGEVTVFSVGRFRVTHIGKRPSFQDSHDDPPSDGSSKHNIADQAHEGKKTEATPKGCRKNGPVQQEHPKHGTPPNSTQKKGLKGRKSSKGHLLQDGAQNADVSSVKDEEFQVSVTKENEIQEGSVKLYMNKQYRRNSSPHLALGEGGTIEMTEIEEHNDSKVTLDRKQDTEKNI